MTMCIIHARGFYKLYNHRNFSQQQTSLLFINTMNILLKRNLGWQHILRDRDLKPYAKTQSGCHYILFFRNLNTTGAIRHLNS